MLVAFITMCIILCLTGGASYWMKVWVRDKAAAFAPMGLGRNGKLVFPMKSLMRLSAPLEKAAAPLPTMMSGLSALDSKSTASLTAAASSGRMIGGLYHQSGSHLRWKRNVWWFCFGNKLPPDKCHFPGYPVHCWPQSLWHNMWKGL